MIGWLIVRSPFSRPRVRGATASAPQAGTAKRHRTAIVAVMSLCLCARSFAFADDASSNDRLPIPNSTAQAKVLKTLRDQYKSQYALRTAEDQLALAKQFREQAESAKDESARQYVLLREARELAVNAGDLDLAFSLIDELSKTFNVDVADMRLTAMMDAVDRSLAPKEQLLESYFKIADGALAEGEVTFALQASRLARRVSTLTRNPLDAQRVRQLELRVHDASRTYTQVVAAARKLQHRPDDPEANLIVGRYLCFVQGKWDQGLPLLTRAADKRLAVLAAKDLEGVNDPDAMVALADRYWELPDAKETPQRRARQRAAHWYQQAMPRLSGDKQAHAQERIRQVQSP